ncbi:MAG: flagellar filament capping protein FliD [Akkermansiaceae bacterium]|nr:flagellar filament capping protein FliD [Verrucomicrobiales bacterium]
MASADLSLSGLASGFDWKSVVDQLVQIERVPEQRLLSDQTLINQRNSAYGNIKTQLAALQTQLAALKNPTLFDSRSASTSDATVATATAAAGSAPGSYLLNVTQLASASKINGSIDVGARLNATSDVSALTLSSAGFPVAVTPGTFTVNGKQITIATSDTLQGVFDKIATATGNAVTAQYDETTDVIRFNSGGEIVLGSATDSSNFLQAARLSNSGAAGAIESSLKLGSIRMVAMLDSANFATAVSDGGSGAGKFKVNGVEISFNATTDSVNTVLSRINNSAAGVTAVYDSVNDGFVLTSKATGDMGVAMEDVTGNFLAATGLGAGSLTHGDDLAYTINGGVSRRSHSNTITEESSGIPGLSITALKENTAVTLTVSNDNSKIKTTIQSFVEAYNRVQSLIDSQTASTTDAKGKVTAGVLAGESDADQIANSLRKTVFSTLAGMTGSLKHLADLGISTNGKDNNLTIENADTLDQALTTRLESVKEFFSDSTNGLATNLDAFLTRTVGEQGSLVAHQDSLSKQAGDIDKQILEMERLVQANKERMTASFVAMETAQARISQQLQYLTKQFSG